MWRSDCIVMAQGPATLVEELIRESGRLKAPEDYFRGVTWDRSLLPDNILCFDRRHQDHRLSGYEGISAKSGKYDQHSRFVLILLLEGEGAIGVEQTIHELQPHDAMLIFPHQLHYYTYLPETFHWLFTTFEVRHGQEQLESLRNQPRRLGRESLSSALRLVELYGSCQDDAGPDVQTVEEAPLSAALELRRLLFDLREQPVAQRYGRMQDNGQNADDIVHRIKRFVYSNLDRDLSIRDVAAHVGFSESYTRAAFKQRIGISLGQFVLAVRLTHSADLLRHSDLKIGAIGEKCGFDSQLSFSRAFKRSFGVSPRDYRKNLAAKTI